MSSCKTCKKTCPLRKKHVWFQRLVIIAIVLVVIELFLIGCVCFDWTQFKIGPLYINLDQDWTFSDRIRFTGLRDIATTIGITGILFAWLLQVIGDKTCGIVMDELFQWEHPHYLMQILFFIQFALVCIYTCGSEHEERIVALVTFIGMICGILNMWIMCATFLFSTKDRRRVGFCFLETHLKAQWNQALLVSWAMELETSASRGEEEFIEACFITINNEVQKEENKSGWERAKKCSDAMACLWDEVGKGRWYTYLPYVVKSSSPDIKYDMLATYFFEAAELSKGENNDERFGNVVDCLCNGVTGFSEVPWYVRETCIAFLAIHGIHTDKGVSESILRKLESLQWGKPTPSEPEEHEKILKEVFRCYAVNISNNPEEFESKFWTDDLIKAFGRYIKVD